MSSVKWCSTHVAILPPRVKFAKRRTEKYEPFPRSAILTVIFSVPSKTLDIVDAMLCFAESIDIIEVDNLGSTELRSAEDIGLGIEA